MEPLFQLGETVITPNALTSLDSEDVQICLGRHARGDWGNLDEHDRQENERSLACGARLFSTYRDRAHVKFYIITEHDRSMTTVLLPEDY